MVIQTLSQKLQSIVKKMKYQLENSIIWICLNQNIIFSRGKKKKAGSSLGFTHSEETKALFRKIRQDRVISEEEKTRASKMYLYRSKESKEQDIERLLKLNAAKSYPVEVMNVLTNEKTLYSSLSKAAPELGVARSTITRALKNKTLIKEIYRISYVNKE